VGSWLGYFVCLPAELGGAGIFKSAKLISLTTIHDLLLVMFIQLATTMSSHLPFDPEPVPLDASLGAVRGP
jgi:hypothetical protein